MRKILLVIDDAKELVMLENLLRRIGFDVLSLSKDILVNDALIRFVPHLVIATGRGRSVDGAKVAARLRKVTPPPRVALCYPDAAQLSLPGEVLINIDAVLESPIVPSNAINVVSKLMGLDAKTLVDKFEKQTAVKWQGPDAQVVSGGEAAPRYEDRTYGGEPDSERGSWDPQKTPGKASVARSERSDRYDRFLENNDEPVDRVMKKSDAQPAMAELERHSRSEREKLDRIDAEKRAFVKTLFDDGPGKGKRPKR